MIDDPSVAAAGRVAWSGIAGVGNGAFDTIYTNLSLSLADPLEPIPSPRTGLYNISYFTTRVAGELVVAYFTSGGSAAGKAGKLRNVLRVTDALGNGVMAVRGAHDIYENDLGFWNSLQLVGGAAGFSVHVGTWGHKIRPYANGSTVGTLGGNIGFRWADDAAPRRGVDVGEYRHVRGHHVHAKAGFTGHGTYNSDTGISVSQNYMKSRGWDHQAMTNKHRELFNELARSGRPNTLTEHSRIAVEALQAGGASRAEARRLVAESLWNLREQGVRLPSGIPWN